MSKPRSPATVARIIKRWNDNPDMTMADLARSTGITPFMAREYVQAAVERGEARAPTAFIKGREKTKAERNWDQSMHGRPAVRRSRGGGN